MSSLTVIGGANKIGRNLIRGLAGKFPHIKLCDFRPHRQAVYELQKELKDKTEFEKKLIYNTYGLERELKDAENVLYVTHDYYSLAPDKLAFLRGTAHLSHASGANKMVAVCPIEYDHYGEVDEKNNPLPIRSQAEHVAIENCKKLSILRPNLIFGDSYFLHYLSQAMSQKHGVFNTDYKEFKQEYYPLSMSNLLQATEHAFDHEACNGKIFNVRGEKSYNFPQLLEGISQQVGAPVTTQNSLMEFGGAMLKGFLIGLTHTKNMRKMIEMHEKEIFDYTAQPNYLEEYELSADSYKNYLDTHKPDQKDLLNPECCSYLKFQID